MRSYPVGRVEEFAEGSRKVVSCDGTEIGVFKIGGELVAWYNQCSHRQGPVCQGRIYQRVIEPVDAEQRTRMLAFDENDIHIVCPCTATSSTLGPASIPAAPCTACGRPSSRLSTGRCMSSSDSSSDTPSLSPERPNDPYAWIDRYAADLHQAARTLAASGEAARVSDEAVAQLLTAAIRLYVAKSDGEERTFTPVIREESDPLTATEVLSAVSELLRALRLGPMELALWYRRRPDED
jgi:nitrite reductase/ring-hydroxylating ferredoxin subunit